MAIDLDALRKKYEQMNKKKGSNEDFLANFYQIKEGTNLIRILPWRDDSKAFYAETKIHRIPEGEDKTKNYQCRKIFDEQCPLCEFYYSLWKTKSKDDEKLARIIKPRERYYLNVLDRELNEVKILSIGQVVMQKILGTIVDPDFGDITDPIKGHDFKIIKVMDGGWPKYDQSQPRPKSESIGDSRMIAEIMDKLHDIHALVKLEDYKELEEVIAGLVGAPKELLNHRKGEVTDSEYEQGLKT